jgi:hypothetical protein
MNTEKIKELRNIFTDTKYDIQPVVRSKGLEACDIINLQQKEIEKLTAEIKEVKHVLFENVIAPNCPTCSNQMSSLCDNGQICMSKLLNAEFIRWDIKKLEAENAQLKKELKND